MAKKIILKYAGQKFEIYPVKEEENKVEKPFVKAPGRALVEISEPVLSAEAVQVGQPVSCKVEVNSESIASIHSVVFYQVKKALIGPVAQDVLRSREERELKGILRPRWAEKNVVEFSVIPQFTLICCGENKTVACMKPELYGVPSDQQIWSVEGVYQRGGGEPFRARFEFDGQGRLMRKTGFYPASAMGVVAPFELFIEDGDTFESYVSVLDRNGEECRATMKPLLLTSTEGLCWQKGDSFEGVFHIGVSVTDFDGQITRKMSSIKIEE